MGRHNEEAAMASSSIALLQERFRQLQRIREKRQERELLKLFSSDSSDEKISPSSSSSSTIHFDPTKFSFQPDQNNNRTTPSSPPSTTTTTTTTYQDSLLSLGLNSSQARHSDFRAMNNPTTSFWTSTSTTSTYPGSSSRSFENHDVDTSLHL